VHTYIYHKVLQSNTFLHPSITHRLQVLTSTYVHKQNLTGHKLVLQINKLSTTHTHDSELKDSRPHTALGSQKFRNRERESIGVVNPGETSGWWWGAAAEVAGRDPRVILVTAGGVEVAEQQGIQGRRASGRGRLRRRCRSRWRAAGVDAGDGAVVRCTGQRLGGDSVARRHACLAAAAAGGGEAVGVRDRSARPEKEWRPRAPFSPDLIWTFCSLVPHFLFFLHKMIPAASSLDLASLIDVANKSLYRDKECCLSTLKPWCRN